MTGRRSARRVAVVVAVVLAYIVVAAWLAWLVLETAATATP
jgi:hypothetical protein